MTIALALRGLGKDYGTRTAVGAVDLDVTAGECLGLLGPNGAGKTTTISMACGVITATRGTVAIAGISLADDPYRAKAKLGLVPQELALYEELSAVQNLTFFAGLYGLRGAPLASKIDWVLGVVGLSDRAREPIKKFSGGMKRRLNLAAGLIHEPSVLVLDEPTVGVDPQSRNHIFETVRALHAKGMTIIYTSHYMEEVEALCDRVAIMDAGAIKATGSVAELIAEHAGKGIELSLAGSAEQIAAATKAAAAHGTVEQPASKGQPSERQLERASAAGRHVLRVVPTAGLAPAIAAIEATGVTIARIESHEANLETAFLALTGKSLRDEAA